MKAWCAELGEIRIYLKRSWLIYIESKVKNYIIYKFDISDLIILDTSQVLKPDVIFKTRAQPYLHES